MRKNQQVNHDREVQRKAKVDEAYWFIRERILSNVRSQESLSELNLASALGMSRTPVREALKRLENEGILVSYGKRGTFVNVPTLQEIKDIYEVRMLLEAGAAKLAAKNIDKNELRNFKKLFESFQNGKGKGDFVKLGGDFHFFIIDSMKNRQLKEILMNIYAKLEISRISSYVVRRMEAVEEHLAIVRALESGDEDLCYSSMQTHLRNAFAALTKRPPRA